ncbi:MAG: Fe2+-dependent dioxygenase [Rhodospirillaceae bacterium]|nr:Fe2+-dependent dioxygenase [Rhodospirillaceae bacterium]|tara:strand:- start:441 stop:1112 length:672 start_codon:yes stop_codon:yes gene_type:complete
MTDVIHNLLSKDELRTISSGLFSAQFSDGKMSGGVLGAELKNNTQVPPSSPQYRELSELVLGAIRKNDKLNARAIPRRILSPIFNSYTKDQEYRKHVDAAMMGPYPGMRTDLSITIFLNDPDAYKGGELVLETPFGEKEYKLPPGDAVLYPTHYVHHVNKITKGRRLAAVTWIESMVPDPQRREVLVDLGEAAEILVRDKGDIEVIMKLEKGRLNLLRMWTST